jgi:hypothetical protein
MDRNLTDQEKEKIINFGALSFPIASMAKVLGWDDRDVENAIKSGEFRELYEKGEAVADYLLNVKLFEMAKAGDIKALEKYQYIKDRRKQFKKL